MFYWWYNSFYKQKYVFRIVGIMFLLLRKKYLDRQNEVFLLVGNIFPLMGKNSFYN